ncbi:MAG: hypothetical protein LQ342_005518 [Letrouitia transgressa]|nr:MAG: hypothetical protein LQ342_005518 [Letrouitia transgressa]
MAEVAAFSTAVSAIDLLALAGRILKRYHDYVASGHRIPKNLQNVANQIPFLRESLRQHAEAEQAALSSGNFAATAFLLAECQTYLTRLQNFIDELIPDPGANRLVKIRKAIKSVRKEDELKQIQSELAQQISALTYGNSVSTLSKVSAHRCIGHAEEASGAIHNAPFKSTYGLPTTKVSKFIGRKDIVSNIINYLIKPYNVLDPSSPCGDRENGLSKNAAASRTIAVLQGMGGQGKTQIALEVCEKLQAQNRFKSILWINARSEDSVVHAFERFAQQMSQKGSHFSDTEAKIDYVLQRIEESRRSCLLIFDNYDDLENFKDIRRYFPTEKRHAVIVTSRNEDSVFLGDAIPISAMSSSEASTLLFERIGQAQKAEDVETAEIIVGRLGFLPLAISQAGAYIKSMKILTKDFMNHYNERASSILQQVPSIWEYGISIFATWEMSMEQYSKDAIERDHIDQMLLFCAILHHEVLDENFLSHMLENLQDLPSWTIPFQTGNKWDTSKFQQAISKLGRLSLIQILTFKANHFDISIHPMISEWLKLRIAPSTLLVNIVNAIAIVACFIQSGSGRKMSFECKREIKSYVFSCLGDLDIVEDRNRGLLQDWEIAYPTNLGQLVNAKLVIADFMFENSYHSFNSSLLEGVLHVCEQRDGFDSPKAREAAQKLAKCYTQLKRYGDAEKMYHRLLAITREEGSCELADCYTAQDRFQAAEDMYLKVLARLENELGTAHPDSIHCLSRLGLCRQQQSSSLNAEQALREVLHRTEEKNIHGSNFQSALTGSETAIPSWMIDRAEAFRGLALIYSDREDYPNAEDMFWNSKNAYEQVYGPHNRQVLTNVHNLAVVYNIQDRLPESEEMYHKTLAGYEELYGPEHEMTFKVCHCYGHVLASQYKLLEGACLHQRSWNGLESIHGPEHEGVISVYRCLVNLTRSYEDKVELEKLYKTALARRKEALGPNHELTINTAFDLVKLYVDEERWVDARELAIQVLAGERGKKPVDIGKVVSVLEMLAHAHWCLSEWPEAEAVCQEILNLQEGIQAYHDPVTLDAAQNLASIFNMQGKSEEAEALHTKYEEGYRKMLKQGEEVIQGVENKLTGMSLND